MPALTRLAYYFIHWIDHGVPVPLVAESGLPRRVPPD